MGLIQRHIKVLIVDDSAVVRQILTRELSRDPAINVVATAGDPYIARDKILRDRPDVVLLDIEMPRMDGLTFLKRLMASQRLPVIIFSSLATAGSNVALEALDCGAIEVLEKPRCDIQHGLANSMARIVEAIKIAAEARVRPFDASIARPPLKAPLRGAPLRTTDKVIVIGASTGGTEALKELLSALPLDCPGILVVIHMPEVFTRRFAERLNDCCPIEVREAHDGDWVHAGLALIAQGDKHLMLSRSGARYHAQVRSGPRVCRHRPSVEVLFQSAAEAAGPNAMGIIMTGMGADGADGLLALRRSGAYTIAQNEASCVVFGMPKEAIDRGAAIDVVDLSQMAQACVKWTASN